MVSFEVSWLTKGAAQGPRVSPSGVCVHCAPAQDLGPPLMCSPQFFLLAALLSFLSYYSCLSCHACTTCIHCVHIHMEISYLLVVCACMHHALIMCMYVPRVPTVYICTWKLEDKWGLVLSFHNGCPRITVRSSS